MKQCHYEVLQVPRDASEADIKRAYRTLVVQWHPDKNSAANAPAQFLLIQEAYEVLSDPQERAYYDSHRIQILRGGEPRRAAESAEADVSGERINLFHFFSRKCFTGFDPAKSADNFYSVYGKAFAVIAEEEVANVSAAGAKNDNSWIIDEMRNPPPFGGPDAAEQTVNRFYAFWTNFVSQKPFAHADEYSEFDIDCAPERFVKRRMMEANKKARKAARAEFSNSVVALAKYVRRRDPRVVQFERDRAAEKQRQAQRGAELREEKQKQQSELRQKARLAHTAAMALLEKQRKAAQEAGAVFIDDAGDDSAAAADDDTPLLVCDVCSKTFRSEGQYRNHESSRKHKAALAAYIASLENDPSILQAKEEGFANDREKRVAAAKASDVEAEAAARQGIAESVIACSSDHGDNGASSSAEQKPASPSETSSSEASSSAEEEEKEVDVSLLVNRRRGGPRFETSSSDSSDDKETEVKSSDSSSSSSSSSDSERRRDFKESPTAEAAAVASKAHGDLLSPPRDRRRRRRAWAGGSDNPAAAPSGPKADPRESLSLPPKGRRSKTAAAAAALKCGICGKEFESRNKLFQHINATGHAQLKTQQPGGKRKR